MDNQTQTLEEVLASLKTFRENFGPRRRLPKSLWNSIIELAKIFPLQEICCQLQIHPAYLKRKIREAQSIPSNNLDFQEIFCEPQSRNPADVIVVELVSKSGLKARIQGSPSCLSYLSSLFRG
jgi:hypothetical protein